MDEPLRETPLPPRVPTVEPPSLTRVRTATAPPNILGRFIQPGGIKIVADLFGHVASVSTTTTCQGCRCCQMMAGTPRVVLTCGIRQMVRAMQSGIQDV
jgi:hypothetical protein